MSKSPLPLLITLHSSLITFSDSFREVSDRALQPLAQRDGRFPPQELPGARDVGPALFRVVLGQRAEARPDFDPGGARDLFGQLAHRELAGVADVHRLVHVELRLRALLAVHQAHHPLDEVVNVAERARLLARPVDGQLLAPERLHDEVRHHAAVVLYHSRPVTVKNPYDARVY